MKRSLGKILYLVMAFSFVLHMFMPLSVLALTTKEITVAWNCDGNVCATTIHVNLFNGFGETNLIATNTISPDGGHTFKAADLTSYGKMNPTPQFLIFNGNKIGYVKGQPPYEGQTSDGKWDKLIAHVGELMETCSVPGSEENPVCANVPLDPVGAKDGLTSVGHNGNQEFRVLFYDEGTKFVKFDVDAEDYTYMLRGWRPIYANPTYELSTDKDKPTVYDTYLLEKFLAFNTEENIASVKALNVSNKGVSVDVKDKRRVEITFNSNYFSDVVFEITFEDGSKGYVEVNRLFVRLADNNEQTALDPTLKKEAYAEFVYPEDKSYEDYDIYATYTVGGKTTTKKLEAVKTKIRNGEAGPDDDQFIENMVVNEGKNLSSTRFKLDITEDTEEVYVTVTKKGATEGTVYGGTFGGNGKGTKLDISRFVYALTHPMEGGE